MKKWTYEELDAQGLIIFKCISGSKAYGTSTPKSDTDIRYIYILPLLDILGLGYVEQVNDATNDCSGYEIRRFMELLALGNPTVVELLGMPEDVILYKDPVFDILLAERDKFITKKLKDSMGGYAKQQIQKAKGQDKMMNWEKDKVTRKTPFDFCYVPMPNGGSMPLLDWLDKYDIYSKHCGLVKLPNMRDMYSLFYDWTAHEREGGDWRAGLNFFANKDAYCDDPLAGMTLGYQGVIRNEETSNDLCLSSVPEEAKALTIMGYNKDGYSEHCKAYAKYEEWLLKRNDARWVDSQTHGQKIDGKNMLHCKRLLDMSREIASGQGVIVRRPDAEELLKIRRGEVNLQELLDWATEEIKVVDKLFDASDLPANVTDEFRDQLLTKIRLTHYKESGSFRAADAYQG